jgi:hypothetical protein
LIDGGSKEFSEFCGILKRQQNSSVIFEHFSVKINMMQKGNERMTLVSEEAIKIDELVLDWI